MRALVLVTLIGGCMFMMLAIGLAAVMQGEPKECERMGNMPLYGSCR